MGLSNGARSVLLQPTIGSFSQTSVINSPEADKARDAWDGRRGSATLKPVVTTALAAELICQWPCAASCGSTLSLLSSADARKAKPFRLVAGVQFRLLPLERCTSSPSCVAPCGTKGTLSAQALYKAIAERLHDRALFCTAGGGGSIVSFRRMLCFAAGSSQGLTIFG